jgi:hypothetical protein
MRKTITLILFLFPLISFSQYLGTASVTQGLGTATTGNLYTFTGGRIAVLGTITATDNSLWTVPAVVNFTNASFPFASDLYNSCNGATFANSAAALAALNGSDIVNVDPNGELITAYVFADNYFEMYINGIAVGKDNVPYTQFNSNIVRFRVTRPFTIAMLLVDWEEHLGLGSEVSGAFQYHDGDGGMVAVFIDSTNNIIAITGNDWKAQTFYTAPITDLTCPSENGSVRLSNNCSTQDSNNGNLNYGLHWSRPTNWTDAAFVDSLWPSATTYSNATIGVNNKPAYTNFTNIFDDPAYDAQFIWSTNVILDNEVIVRYTVSSTTSIINLQSQETGTLVYPNPAKNEFQISDKIKSSDIKKIIIFNTYGEKMLESNLYSGRVSIGNLAGGLYFIYIITHNLSFKEKLIVH